MKFRFVWMGADEDPLANPRTLQQAAEIPARSGTSSYEQRGHEMIRCQRLANGRIKHIAIANFSARIVCDLIRDDDADQWRELGIEAEVSGQKLAFVLPTSEFGQMAWVLRKLGPRAIIYPGQQHHARAAIQWLSVAIRQERIFSHLGWRKHGPDWIYLHAGGAIGSHVPNTDMRIELPPALNHFQMAAPADPREQVRAVRASLNFLSLAPDRISFPLLTAVYRAALGKVEFSVFLAGQTGTFKTALAALCQQHFGAAMEASRLPANFSSTANSLEALAFSAKDALLVVDDFVPRGPGDHTLQALAERLFRAAGNQQGRSRLGRDGRINDYKPPRGLLLATGEEVPRGRSIRARLLIVGIRPGEVDRSRLSQCQTAARQGDLAAAMGAFLKWSAGQYEELRERLEMRSAELRNQNRAPVAHARIPAALAELRSGWEIWLRFAFEIGAIKETERSQLEERNCRALQELAELQTRYHHASDPAFGFVALLRAALEGGRAHLANRHGKPPDSPEIWGWQRKAAARGCLPQGIRIGWVVGNDLFLEPKRSYAAAQQSAGIDGLGLSEQALRRCLRERGLLASTDAGRQMLLVRRILEGRLQQVLHLKTNTILPNAL